MVTATAAPPAEGIDGAVLRGRRHDLQRTFQLVLATVWLLDAILQIQPFMFTPGRNGFSGMLHDAAAGTPGVLGHTITWNASVVAHQPVLTNTLFALIQFVIAFGLCSRRTVKPALALSILWSLGVWWFGDGFGGVFSGAASPFAGGPGGVLFYALLAVLLWPGDRAEAPFVAARSIGAGAARLVWAGVWALLAVLCVVGAGRQGQALHDLVTDMAGGEPGWLAHVDGISAPFLAHHGTQAAVLLGLLCVLDAVSVYLRPEVTRVMIGITCAVFAVIWVAVQNVGGVLLGGMTDPGTAPLVVIFALTYWPLETWTTTARTPGAPPASRATAPSPGTAEPRSTGPGRAG